MHSPPYSPCLRMYDYYWDFVCDYSMCIVVVINGSGCGLHIIYNQQWAIFVQLVYGVYTNVFVKMGGSDGGNNMRLNGGWRYSNVSTFFKEISNWRYILNISICSKTNWKLVDTTYIWYIDLEYWTLDI